jgi:hypothetical protein
MTTNLACDCVSCGDVFKLFVDWLVGFFSNTGIGTPEVIFHQVSFI